MVNSAAVDSGQIEINLDNQKEQNSPKSKAGIRCWSGRTKGERCLSLAFTTVLCVAVVLALFLASFVTDAHRSSSNDEFIDLPNAEALVTSSILHSADTPVTKPNDVCLSKGCVKAAAAMINRMNDTADPCDDFYEFSCGGFVKQTIIPDEKSSVTSFSIVRDALQEKMRRVIEEQLKPEDSVATKMVKDLYKSCMDTVSIEAAGLTPIRELLKEMGGWPVVEGPSWNESAFSWVQANYNNRRLGFSIDYLFDFSVTTDLKNSSRRMIWVDQPKTGLDREYLVKGLNDSDVQAYLTYTTDLAKLLGADPAMAEKEMLDVINFQIAVANISTPREERRNRTKLYNVMPLGDFAQKVPLLQWVEYINNLFIAPLKVDESERIGVSDINYFLNLIKLLDATPKRTIANYIMVRVTDSAEEYLSDDIRNLYLAYSKKRTGKSTRAPRWKECMDKVTEKLPYASGNLYVKNFFDNQAKNRADTLVNYVRQEFKTILKAIDWMDETTRQNALEKADKIAPHIAYPLELLDDANLDEYYKDLVIDDKELLANMRRIGIFSTDESFRKLREPVDKLDWKRHASVAVVNAYYSFIDNSISFPAGILQDVFFEPDRPNYMNFGAIGFVIGHEITHGFDDQGKQFDGFGNLQNWWQKVTEDKYLGKAKCIIEQYGNFTAPENGLNLNGINTQGENIADNGGLKETYGAYQKWVQDNGVEGTLPGLSYTSNQLFWVSAAQIWCSKYRPKSLQVSILTGVHSPGRFRVVGPFSNSKEFAKDWNCPINSKMNPEKKCQVW